MRVYAIHSGEYSDQTWGPVFSTVEKALAYAAKDRSKYWEARDVEVHVLDDEKDTGPVYPGWRMLFDRDGDVLAGSPTLEPIAYEERLQKPEAVFTEPFYYFMRDNPTAHVLVDVYAPDFEHAVKIAADVRRKFLSEQGAKP